MMPDPTRPTQQTHPALLSPRQTAEWLGVKVSTLAQYRCRGTGIPFVRVGSGIRYRADDVAAFIAALPRHRSTSDTGSVTEPHR